MPRKAPKKTGRPTSYTARVGETICDRIAEGESLVSICRETGMPAYRTVMGWLTKGEEGQETYTAFAHNYARARENQAERYAQEVIEIADTETDWNRARVRIDARKWAAGKMLPKRYGTDRIEHAGDAAAPLRIVIEEVRGGD
jgi:hypothetical protein